MIKYISFIIAFILSIIYFINFLILPSSKEISGEIYNYSIYDSVVYGFIGLVLTLILVIFKKNIWKYLFLILILLSFTELIEFSNLRVSFTFGFLNVNLISLVFLISHLALNSEMFFNIIQKINPDKEISQELQNQYFEERVNQFEVNFKNKSKTDLEQIIKENKLLPEAVEAARRILKDT